MDASKDQIKDFIQCRFQHQQLLPNHQSHSSKKCAREQRKQTSENRKPHNLMTYALQKSKERVSTVTRKDTKSRNAQQRNARMQHNFRIKTDKTLDRKDKAIVRSWYATNKDILGNLHETVDMERTQPPHTEPIPTISETQKNLHNQPRCRTGKLYRLDAKPCQICQAHAAGATQSNRPIPGRSTSIENPTAPRAHLQWKNRWHSKPDTFTDPDNLNPLERRIYDEKVNFRAQEKLDPNSSQEQRQTFLSWFNWDNSQLGHNKKQRIEQLLVKFRQLFARNPVDIVSKTDFRVEFMPRPDKPIYAQSLKTPSNMKTEILVKVAQIQEYGLITTLHLAKIFCHVPLKGSPMINQDS